MFKRGMYERMAALNIEITKWLPYVIFFYVIDKSQFPIDIPNLFYSIFVYLVGNL